MVYLKKELTTKDFQLVRNLNNELIFHQKIEKGSYILGTLSEINQKRKNLKNKKIEALICDMENRYAILIAK